MSAVLALVVLATHAAVFDVVPIPLGQPGAQVFPVATGAGDAADVAILTENTLHIYEIIEGQRRFSVALPEDTSVFDIVDITGDGVAEIVAVQRHRVLALRLDTPQSPPRELFPLEDPIEHTGGYALPHTLAVQRDGEWLLAIPRTSALELRTLDGEVVDSVPPGDARRSPMPFDRPFMARTVDPPLVAPPGAIELHIDQVVVHDAPHSGSPARETADIHHRGSLLAMRHADEDDYQRWPWFPLLSAGGAEQRVLYRLTEPDYEDTLIRIQQPDPARPFEAETGVRVSPARRYRGSLLPPWHTLPDFNADGYTDLLLWVAPSPGRSVEAITRALGSQSWPLELRMHLFEPDKNRYDPRNAGIIKARVPIGWFLHPERGSPLRLLVKGDFNGDGRTGVAFATDENEFCAWLYDDGFPARPSFRYTFPEPLSSVETRGDLDGSGRTGVILRGNRNVYVLRPANGG